MVCSCTTGNAGSARARRVGCSVMQRAQLRVSAWQHADLAALGLSADDCAEAVLWVEDGRFEAGPDAVAAYLWASSRNWRTAGRVPGCPCLEACHVAGLPMGG